MFTFRLCYTVLFFAIVSFCDCRFVDTLEKCPHDDWECLKRVIQGVLENASNTGIPEHDVPPFDPLRITNIKFNFLDVVELTVSDGTLKGLKNCAVDEMKLQLDKGKGKLKLLCSIVGKGKYSVTKNTPEITKYFGNGNLTGNGNAKIKIDKLLVTFEFHFDVVKRSDGEIYIECKKNLLKYDFDLLGSSQLALDNLYIGGEEASKVIVDYYNQNSKTLWKTFGNSILLPAKEIAYEMVHKFFSTVPAKYYLAGDLSQFVKK